MHRSRHESPAETGRPSQAGPQPLDGRQAFELMTRPQRTVATDAERELLTRAQRRDVVHRDRRLAVRVWGASGPRVLMVHGWSSRASHLASLIEALHGAGMQVVAFDAPGHGDSEGGASNVVDVGRAVLAVVDQLGGVEGLVAHSVGSPAALYAFADGLRVAASVHVAGPTSLDRAMRRFAWMCGLPAGEMPVFRRLMEERIGMPVAGMELDHLRGGFRHPALLLHDPDDAEVPYDESLALNAAWPGSSLTAVRGAGHRRILASPHAVEAASAFLTEHLDRPEVTH